MSYILDALQRADAERERGTVPGLHAQPLGAPERRRDGHSQRTFWTVALVACTVAALFAGWWFGRGSTTVPVATTAPAAPAIAPLQTPSAPASVVSAPLPLPLPLPLPVPLPAPKAQQALTTAEQTAPVPEKAASAAPVGSPTPAQRASAPLPWLAELPEETRRQVATLTITGAVYSENPSQRLLLVNGQVLPQGSLVVPEVTLEEIRERHSVFNFRGTRFRLTH
jgi:general secretion pathway protein B